MLGSRLPALPPAVRSLRAVEPCKLCCSPLQGVTASLERLQCFGGAQSKAASASDAPRCAVVPTQPDLLDVGSTGRCSNTFRNTIGS